MTFEYKIIRNFVDQATCDAMVARLDSYVETGLALEPDMLCPLSPAFYGIFNDECQAWLPRIQEATGKRLWPTYTYSRIYANGETLPVHKDRAACEYSITLALKYDEKPWAIWLTTSEGDKEIVLDVGDILIYNGIKTPHWRDALESQYQYQAFLHYVDQEGPLAGCRFDRRSKFQTTQEAAEVTLRNKNVAH